MSAPSQTRAPAAVDKSRRGITAEYGITGGHNPAVPEGEAQSAPPPPFPEIDGNPDGTLERMRTEPAIKRLAPPPRKRSGIPTEEVLKVGDSAELEAVDDEDFEKTQPRVTINPTHGIEPKHPKSSMSPPYDDTLQFQRTAESGATSVPQARKHLSSDELINALEDLLPSGDEHSVRPDSALRPDARVHQPPQPSFSRRTLFDSRDTGDWPKEDPGMSAADRMEMRMQHALEEAERAQRYQQGLECLIDILEYRELRLRSLRGEEFDKERFAALQQRLQQPSLTDSDNDAMMRRYHRFVCSIPAQLTHRERGSISSVTVEVEDLSAGGAKITFGEYSIDSGDIVWLAFDLTDVDRRGTVLPDANTVVFKARIVWARAHDAQLGLIFAGAPRYGEEANVDLDL